MQILVKPNICMAISTHPGEQAALEGCLRFKNPYPSYEQKINPYYDGIVEFFLDPWKQKFPTGFLSHVVSKLAESGIYPDIKIVKDPIRMAVTVDPKIFPGVELRDYQVELATLAIRKNRGVICAPPRSGKTLIQAAVAATINLKSVIFVQRAGLLEQHVKTLRGYGLDVGIVQGNTREYDKLHSVAMLQTIHNSINNTDMQRWLDSIEVMQIDETHHIASAESYFRSSLNCPASWRLGYSGTPYSITDLSNSRFNQDHWRMAGALGPLIGEISLGELQKRSLLVSVDVYQIRCTQPDMTEVDGNDWHNVYKKGIVDNDERNNMVVGAVQRLVDGRYSPLVLVKQISHGQCLFDMMKAVGLRPIFSKGGKSILAKNGWESGSVKDAYSTMMNAGYNVLIATQIADEGVDLPDIDSLVLAVGGKADKTTIQRVFRPLTHTANKTKAIVIDFDDCQHGVLRKHSRARRGIYDEIGFDPKIINSREFVVSEPN